MRRLIRKLTRRQEALHKPAVPAAEDDMRLLFQVVMEKRQRRGTEGRHLFQELEAAPG